jgi:hypothetical protein
VGVVEDETVGQLVGMEMDGVGMMKLLEKSELFILLSLVGKIGFGI